MRKATESISNGAAHAALIICITVIGFLCSGLLCSCKAGDTIGLAPGDKPPPFTLYSTSKEKVTLHSFDGKDIVINFWATWCPPCIKELTDLEALHRELSKRGGTVIGIAVQDSEEKAKAVADRFKVTYPILLDPEGKVRDAFKVTGLPESFLVSANGKFVLFPDVSSGPTVKIVGEREWGSSDMLGRVLLSFGKR